MLRLLNFVFREVGHSGCDGFLNFINARILRNAYDSNLLGISANFLAQRRDISKNLRNAALNHCHKLSQKPWSVNLIISAFVKKICSKDTDHR